MKKVRNIETGEVIEVHPVDARDHIKSGLYEDLGDVPMAPTTRTMTVAELAGVKSKAVAVATKVDVMNLPEVKAALDAAASTITALEGELAEANRQIDLRNASIQELQTRIAELEAGGVPEPESIQTRIADLESRKAEGQLKSHEHALLARLKKSLSEA